MTQKTDTQVDRCKVDGWANELDALHARLGPRFARSELRRRAQAYLRGLLGPAERKNSWQLAEETGDPTPYGLQHLLGRANWEADLLRDDLRQYVLEHLGEEEDPGDMIVVDETSFLKKGEKSVGVARQYCGTVGKVENCQVGVFLAYASSKGTAFIDRELYLPEEEWAEDRQRMRAVGVPEEVGFATKPKLAQKMLERALVEAGVEAAWVVADLAYGDARYLGVMLEEREQPYVLSVSGKAQVWVGFDQPKVSEILTTLQRQQGEPPPSSWAGEEEGGWRRLSCGEGAKGERLYDWIRLPLNDPPQEGFSRWLMVRRSISDPEKELAAYVVFCPEGTSLGELARVAGSRWAIEVAFEEAKGEVGLDHYEVRSWQGWYRHITLALFAHAFLAAIRAASQNIETPPKKGEIFAQQEEASSSSSSSSLAAFKRGRGL